MSVASAAISFIPTYEQIGILAPISVLICRLTQGIAAGGEWGAASAFLYEFAPDNRKAFYSSWRPVGSGLGLFLGSSMLALVASLLPAEAANAWGWRIPFLVVALLGGIGLYIRKKIDETPSFRDARARNELSQKPIQEMIASSKKAALVMFGFLFIWNVVYFVIFYYLPSYLDTVLNVPSHVTLQTNSLATLVYTVLIPVVGLLSDKFGKELFLLLSAVGITVLSIPEIILLNPANYISLLGVQLIFAILMALYAGPATATIAELFPTRVRNTAVSMTFNIHTALVAGTAPMFCVWLTKELGSPIAPAYYMVFSSIKTLFSILAMKTRSGKVFVD